MSTTLTEADRRDHAFRAGYLSSAIAHAIAALETDPTAAGARRVAGRLRDALDECRLPGPTPEQVEAARAHADGLRMQRRWAADRARTARLAR